MKGVDSAFGQAGPPVALVGPTASGKSALAVRLAGQRPGTEIVSVDSMGVYRQMDIGTAKPSAEQRRAVPHHLLDLVDPDEEFTVGRFQRLARAAISAIESGGGRALLVGGTGLYHRAVIDDLHIPGRWPRLAAAFEGQADEPGGLRRLHRQLAELDPVAAGRIEPDNRRRIVRALEVTVGSGRPFSSSGPGLQAYPPTRFVLVGIPFVAELHDPAIERRFRQLLDAGLLDEVRRLAARPGGLSRTARQALGYRELLEHVERGVALTDAVERAVRRTRAFARRQWAWFRRDPRITWLEPHADLDAQLRRHFDATAGCFPAASGAGHPPPSSRTPPPVPARD